MFRTKVSHCILHRASLFKQIQNKQFTQFSEVLRLWTQKKIPSVKGEIRAELLKETIEVFLNVFAKRLAKLLPKTHFVMELCIKT